MKASAIPTLTLLLIAFLLTPWHQAHSRPLPPYPLAKARDAPSPGEEQKALELFDLAAGENRRLVWDQCLSRKAFLRAKKMVESETFAHKDPGTGKNPAWAMVTQCRRVRYAGENLAKGRESAEAVHRALMQSPSHRANIVSPRFRFLGVGCYEQVCVQLFAGT